MWEESSKILSWVRCHEKMIFKQRLEGGGKNILCSKNSQCKALRLEHACSRSSMEAKMTGEESAGWQIEDAINKVTDQSAWNP